VSALHGVLVTYRRASDLAVMLARLAEQERTPDTLVVVDNDPAESARQVVEEYAAGKAGVSYLPAGDNLGPAGGLALGMRDVLRHAGDADWVVLLDDDDPPRTADMLAQLERFGNELRAKDPSVAAVGKSGTNFDIDRARSFRVDDRELVGAVPSHCIGGNQLPFYSVHAIRAVGVFDERLFFGFDDLEYGLRLRAAGYGVYAHGGLWRRDREQLGRLGMNQEPDRRLAPPTWRRYYSLRNMLYILRQRGAHVAALRLAARGVGKPIYNLPRDPGLALRSLRLNLRAVTDAYAGRMGRTVEPVAKG
jgi:glycosyltransferase involved in cell wall biosynthesis